MLVASQEHGVVSKGDYGKRTSNSRHKLLLKTIGCGNENSFFEEKLPREARKIFPP